MYYKLFRLKKELHETKACRPLNLQEIEIMKHQISDVKRANLNILSEVDGLKIKYLELSKNPKVRFSSVSSAIDENSIVTEQRTFKIQSPTASVIPSVSPAETRNGK